MTSNGSPPLTSDDLEEVLLELNRYEKSPTQNIPNILERYLIYVAKTGCAYFPWTKVKPLFRAKLENVIVDFSNLSPAEEIPPVPNVDVFNFAAIRNKVFEQLDAFAGIPFTVQRLAELLTTPRRHYKRTDKFMRALEKNMLIVSTVEARTNNNNDSESNYLMNGDYLSNGNAMDKDEENNPTTSDEELARSNSAALLQRDGVEDELDAEMSEAPAANENATPVAADPPVDQDANVANPSGNIDDEMVTDEDDEGKSDMKIPEQSIPDSKKDDEEEAQGSDNQQDKPVSNEAEESKMMEVESSSSEDKSEEAADGTTMAADSMAAESSAPSSTQQEIVADEAAPQPSEEKPEVAEAVESTEAETVNKEEENHADISSTAEDNSNSNGVQEKDDEPSKTQEESVGSPSPSSSETPTESAEEAAMPASSE